MKSMKMHGKRKKKKTSWCSFSMNANGRKTQITQLSKNLKTFFLCIENLNTRNIFFLKKLEVSWSYHWKNPALELAEWLTGFRQEFHCVKTLACHLLEAFCEHHPHLPDVNSEPNPAYSSFLFDPTCSLGVATISLPRNRACCQLW